MTIRTRIIASGYALPSRRVSNDDLTRRVDTTDAWIYQRTGVRERRIASESESTRTLARDAARMALERASIGHADVDAIILATTTPDQTFPATATQVQADLGITQGFAFDVQAVCSGFLYALSVADAMLRSGCAKRALVIGADTMSRLMDWEDRSTCVLFGDGAGAIVLEAFSHEGGQLSRGYLGGVLRSDGRYGDHLFVDGGLLTGKTGALRMRGREVFKIAVGTVPSVIDEVLSAQNLKITDVDWFVAHQGNRRIVESTAQKVGIPPHKVVHTIEKFANTSGASIPLSLALYDEAGRFKTGQLILLEAIGGGLTWGASLLRW